MVLGLLAAGAARAQNPEIPGTLDRSAGGVSSGTVREQAQTFADRAGLGCDVVDAALRGRDEGGSQQWEVACAEGDGYVVLGPPAQRAIDCLAMSSGSRCRLPGNADVEATIGRLARAAGITCPMDDGRLVGRSAAGTPIYEVGCFRTSGAWLERDETGWRTTDCVKVVARGGECRFTSQAEIEAGLIQRLAPACDARAGRWMGSGRDGDWYEVACRDGRGLVARYDVEDRLVETLPCDQAARIGDGCRLTRD